MRYRGCTITAYYLPGADFTVRNGVVRSRKPKRCDVDYYRVEEDGQSSYNELTLADAKSEIDRRSKLGVALCP